MNQLKIILHLYDRIYVTTEYTSSYVLRIPYEVWWGNCPKLKSTDYDLEAGEVLINGHMSIEMWGDVEGENIYGRFQSPVQWADWGDY